MHPISKLPLLLAVGCVPIREVAPPPTPPAALPELDITPVTADGKTLVGIDSVDAAAKVEEVTQTETASTDVAGAVHADAHAEALVPVCHAPCAVALSPGGHRLRFTREPGAASSGRDDVTLNVGARPVVLRHEVARDVEHNFGIDFGGSVMFGIGLAVVVVGGLLVGLSPMAVDDAHRDNTLVAGGGTLAVGVALAAIGTVLHFVAQGSHQPGATRTWTTSGSPYVLR